MAFINAIDINKVIIEKFKNYFILMDFDDDSILRDIYSNNVVFTDPIHEIYGIEKLSEYFIKLNSNLIEGSFQFTDESVIDNKVYLSWEMSLKLKKPNKSVNASGISVLTIDEKIIKQRDYFDAG